MFINKETTYSLIFIYLLTYLLTYSLCQQPVHWPSIQELWMAKLRLLIEVISAKSRLNNNIDYSVLF